MRPFAVSIVQLALATAAAASPVAVSNNTMYGAAFTGFHCPSKYGGTSFSKTAVWDAFAHFPHRDHPGQSGYPHAFANSENFVWDVNGATCNDGRACGTMMEMPILDNGGVYSWDAWPRPDPGPTRVIYCLEDENWSAVCGLVNHFSEAGYFDKCTLTY